MDMIGRFRITGRIGSGSFATVFRGHDDELDQPVAVKVLAEYWATNDDVRARFLSEAELLQQLSDERIVQVHDIGTTDRGLPYFAMELADAGSLEDLRRDPPEPGRTLRLCAEAARALEVLHRNHFVHRDITPSNILLADARGGVRVMLADLGVARSLMDEYDDTATVGTPSYMALEQATTGQVDQRSDIYSLACVTYACLTGNPPFPARTLDDLTSRDEGSSPAPIAEQIGAPARLDEVMGYALSPDPACRPHSALALAEVLDELADGLPGADTYTPRPLAPAPAVAEPVRPTPEPESRPSPVPSPAPAPRAEHASPWSYVWVTASALLLLAVTILLTVYVLTS